ncbi:MAG: winged helix-turn-helix transcriptional regulator [Saprospiraceae bacterium]|nr:winged helix-turn-helix transcriptional regulator [Saprospiraceae bacterium]
MPIESRRDIFQAISDPNRRQIIDLLSGEALTLNAIAEKFDISRPAVSQHIKHLEECGVVEIEQRGRERFCKVNPQSLIPAFMWLEQYQQQWIQRIDQFEKHIETIQNKDKK